MNFPDIIGPLSATTSAGQNLSSNCANVLPVGTQNCTLSLTGQPPLNWLLLRAGTLPDAETLNLTPQYNQRLWEEHSLKAEVQLRYNRSSPATSSETPIMVGVTSTMIPGLTKTLSTMVTVTPTGTTLPDEDRTAWEEWGRWTTVAGAFGVVAGVALVTAGITYGVLKIRRQTVHGAKP